MKDVFILKLTKDEVQQLSDMYEDWWGEGFDSESIKTEFIDKLIKFFKEVGVN
jgi:hypothetical protein